MERVLITSGPAVATEILIGPNLVAATASLLPPRSERRRVAILTQPGRDDDVAPIAASMGADIGVEVSVLPDRDAAKTLEVAEQVYTWLNSMEMTRHDTLIVVGGGAATDVGGFIGATFLRGIETVLVPTTLLGAVDAAVGGKTAVNVGGKNLAGVFRHPALVIIDTAILAQLPEALLIEGAAEALKAGFIADPALIDLYRGHGLAAPMQEVVRRAVDVKANVVTADFTEQGTRAILNYGHTIGHAVEYVAAIPHGHAVAIGMVAAGAASAAVKGFEHAADQKKLLTGLGLPVAAPHVDLVAIEAALALDKKRDASGLRMVLLEDYGRPVLETVHPTTVRAALEAVGIDGT